MYNDNNDNVIITIPLFVIPFDKRQVLLEIL